MIAMPNSRLVLYKESLLHVTTLNKILKNKKSISKHLIKIINLGATNGPVGRNVPKPLSTLREREKNAG